MWTDSEKQLLISVLDELIPPSANGRVPGAGTLGVAEFISDSGGYANDPIGSVRAVLAYLTERTDNFAALEREDRVELLRDAETETADAFAVLVRLTYMGYYSRPEIRPLFGVGQHAVHPDGYQVSGESDVLLQELTEPVRSRGEVYRG